jgi:deoxyribonucleoside regulator
MHKKFTPEEIADIIRRYHRDEETLKEIASALGVDKQKIYRELKAAEKQWIVRIQIIAPPLIELGAQLITKFVHLNKAIVVPSCNDFIFQRRLCAEAAAKYFEELIEPKESKIKSIALGGGHTLYEMVDALPIREREIEIYQTAIQGRGPILMTPDRAVITSLLWSKSGERATAYTASVPSMKQKFKILEEVAAAALKFAEDPVVSEVFKRMKAVDCVFTTLGTIGNQPKYNEYSPQSTLRLLADNGFDAEVLKLLGMVGEVSYNFFNLEGETKPGWQLGISLGVNELKWMVNEKKTVVLVAGECKEDALRGALNGKMCNVLITDSRTAKLLLES